MRFIFLLLILIAFPALLSAHGTGDNAFMHGFTHPIFGIDHMLAILGVAILGHYFLHEKPWLPSILFVIAMVIGSVFGVKGDVLPYMEEVIKFSIVICGILIWGKFELTLVGFALIGIFAGYFHGYAHGYEMPSESNTALYTGGFVLGAIIVSLVGYGIAKFFTDGLGIRTIGAFLAGLGTAIFFGL